MELRKPAVTGMLPQALASTPRRVRPSESRHGHKTQPEPKGDDMPPEL